MDALISPEATALCRQHGLVSSPLLILTAWRGELASYLVYRAQLTVGAQYM